MTAALVAAFGGARPAAADAVDQPEGRNSPQRRVAVSLDVEGQVHGPVSGSGEPDRQRISMQAAFKFDESIEPGNPDAAARRRYTEATATLDVDGDESRLELAADARLVTVARLGMTPLPFLPSAYLSRDELELLETPFDSLLLEDLLPGRPVSDEDRWVLNGDLTAGLLAIDTVEAGSLEARLDEVQGGTARVLIEGVVDGAVDGVPTHVVVEGSFTVAAEPDEDGHMLIGDVVHLDTVIKERRQASHVAAGFEVEARLAVDRSPATAGEDDFGADQEPAAAGLRRRGHGRPGLVWWSDSEGRYDLVHDVGWRCVEDDHGGVVLRLLDLGALVAQCSITALPRSEQPVAPSVEEVKRHVEQSLTGQFKRFDGVAETVRAEDGARIVRVASEGSAEGLAFRWVHYVITDNEGHRVNVTFMHEASLAKRFGDADARLVAGLRLAVGGEREACLPSKTAVP